MSSDTEPDERARLAPCMFHAEPERFSRPRIAKFDFLYRVLCPFCGAQGPSGSTEVTAARQWNRRPPAATGAGEVALPEATWCGMCNGKFPAGTACTYSACPGRHEGMTDDR